MSYPDLITNRFNMSSGYKCHYKKIPLRIMFNVTLMLIM